MNILCVAISLISYYSTSEGLEIDILTLLLSMQSEISKISMSAHLFGTALLIYHCMDILLLMYFIRLAGGHSSCIKENDTSCSDQQ